MKYKALVTAELIPSFLECFKEKIDFEFAGYALTHDVMPREELKEKIKDIDILICEYDTIDKEIFDCAKQLKIIFCCRGGVKTVIDLEVAAERGIIVCNNGGRNASAVSDLVMAFMLDMTRNVTLTSNLIHNRVITTDVKSKPDEYRDTVWGLDNNSPFIKYRGKSLNHMTLGLIGCGFAGKLVARKAMAFGMKVIVYDPYIKLGSLPQKVEMVEFDELLNKADIISLHCALTPQTKDMFGAEQFAKMKQGAFFINTARGELVDEDALISALNSDHLAGAAIDVTRVEPIADNSPLLDAKNLIITPHIGGSSYDVQVVGTNMVVDDLKAWLKGKKPYNCVIGG
ncbi:MAG: hypothetical protein E7531_03790 [Ruminococcaceae bacterium]|nr:hypothetical protein [Oscillospiraceae bacterium]